MTKCFFTLKIALQLATESQNILSSLHNYLDMIEFDQYLGFIAFLTILTIGFWLMIFLLTFVIPYWLTGSFIEFLKERKKEKEQTVE